MDFLKPVAGKHSIKHVVAGLFIPQAFIKPQDVFERLKEKSSFEGYQKKNLMHSRTIDLKRGAISTEEAVGFIFEAFDDKGAVKHILRLENRKDNQAVISLETRDYEGWKSFKTKLLKDLKLISDNIEFYVEALSLNFRDEFFWTDKAAPIPVKSIFNIQSDMLTTKFLGSKNGTFMLNTQGEEAGVVFEEKTELAFNNSLNRIVIDHRIAKLYDEIKDYADLTQNELDKDFDFTHLKNKTILKDLLTPKVQSLINLS